MARRHLLEMCTSDNNNNKNVEGTKEKNKKSTKFINHKGGDKAPPSSPPKPPTDAILPASATPMVKRSSKAALASAPQRKAKTAIS